MASLFNDQNSKKCFDQKTWTKEIDKCKKSLERNDIISINLSVLISSSSLSSFGFELVSTLKAEVSRVVAIDTQLRKLQRTRN